MMDALLLLAISLGDKILSGEILPITDEERQTTIKFLDSQSDKLDVNLVGTTPYGLTDQERCDFVSTLIFAAAKLEKVGGEA